MTIELESTTYTDSALSDLFMKFLSEFKKAENYYYVKQIDCNIIQQKEVIIDYDDFTPKIKSVIGTNLSLRIKQAIYRAVGEVFQIRAGSAIRQSMQEEDSIQIKIINCPTIDDTIFGNLKNEKESAEPKITKSKSVIDDAASRIKRNHRFMTLRKTNEILSFNGKIYSESDAESIIREETEKIIENCTTHDRNEVINKIKARTFMDIEDFDSEPGVITVENCILNMKTLELSKHNPEHLSRVLLPVEYIKPPYSINEGTIFEDIEENLEDTLFWQALKRCFIINERFQQVEFESVLEMMASVFIKKNIDARAFINLGDGENGKSVFLSYIITMLGKQNVSGIPLQDIENDRFMAFNLVGKMANIFADLRNNELRYAGKIKSIFCNEGIEVQAKHGQPFTAYPFCKMIFSCNRFPKVFDQGQGFFRRWIIIKWERNFENDPEKDPHLLDKLLSNKEEMNLVFSCLVYLARKLEKIGKFSHSKDWKLVQKEWNENADPIDDFDSNCIVESDNHKTIRETYRFYKETMLEKGETPLGPRQFSNAFAQFREFDRVEIDGRTQRVWLNIDFKRPVQTSLQEVDST